MLHVTMDWSKLMGQNMSPALLFKFILGLSTVIADVRGACDPPTCRRVNGREVPCSTCPLGYGVKVKNRQPLVCQSDRDTQCIQCVSGVNYSDVVDSQQICRSCHSCNMNMEDVERNCTTTDNIVCRCKHGFYKNVGVGSCWKCPNCTTSPEHETCRSGRCPSATPEMTTRPTSQSTVTTREMEAVSGAGGSTTKLMDQPKDHPTGKPTKGSNDGSKHAYRYVLGVLGGMVLLAFGIGVYKAGKRYSWCTHVCKAFSRSKDIQTVHGAVYNSVTRENGQRNGVLNGHAGRSPDPETPCEQPNGVLNGHAGRALHLETSCEQPNGVLNGHAGRALHPETPCEQPNGVLNGHAGRAPYPQPTAPPQEGPLTRDEEYRLSLSLMASEAVRLAREELNISDHTLAIWEDQREEAYYLLEEWKEHDLSRDKIVADLVKIGRQDLADYLKDGGA